MSTDRAKNRVAILILAVVPALLFIDILAGANALYSRDIVPYYYPAKTLLRNIVLGGEFPYWNPLFSAGQPLAANPEHEVFYPLTWLILLPSFNFAFQLLPIIHICVAIFGMYAFLRSLATGRTAAVFGSLAFGIGGLTISTISFFPILFSIAWLPLTCLFARRFMKDRDRRSFALACFFLGMQLLVGEPITALQSGLLLGLYALWRGWNQRRFHGAIRRVIDVAAISAGGLLLSAVQALPAFDHVGDSVRSRGFDFASVARWSMPWQRIGEFVYPHLFGLSLPDAGVPYWGGPMYPGANSPFYFSIYSGLAVAVLCGAGLAARTRGAGLFATTAVVSLILALGSHTPLLRLIHDAGLFRSFRYPEKFLLMGAFAAIVFAAAGLDRILAGDQRLRRLAMILTVIATGIAAVAAVISRTSLYGSLLGALVGTPLPPTPPMVAHAQTSWIVATATGAALFILLRSVASSSRAVWRTAFLAWLLLDLVPLAVEIAPRMPATFYEQTPRVIEQLPKDHARFRLFHYADLGIYNQTGSRFVHNHQDRYWVRWNGITPMLPAAWGIRTALEVDFDRTTLLATEDFKRAMLQLGTPDWINVMAGMSNVGYVAVWENPDEAIARAGGRMREVQPIRIVGGADHPRYYFASRIVRFRGLEDFVGRLRRERFPRDVAFVEQPEFTPAAGIVRRIDETANTVALDVETSGVGFLVMSVTPHKYWSIHVDGKAAEAVRTNVGYQGIVVAPGRHEVVMRYRNPLVALGGGISLVALSVLAAMVLVPRRTPAGESLPV